MLVDGRHILCGKSLQQLFAQISLLLLWSLRHACYVLDNLDSLRALANKAQNARTHACRAVCLKGHVYRMTCWWRSDSTTKASKTRGVLNVLISAVLSRLAGLANDRLAESAANLQLGRHAWPLDLQTMRFCKGWTQIKKQKSPGVSRTSSCVRYLF